MTRGTSRINQTVLCHADIHRIALDESAFRFESSGAVCGALASGQTSSLSHEAPIDPGMHRAGLNALASGRTCRALTTDRTRLPTAVVDVVAGQPRFTVGRLHARMTEGEQGGGVLLMLLQGALPRRAVQRQTSATVARDGGSAPALPLDERVSGRPPTRGQGHHGRKQKEWAHGSRPLQTFGQAFGSDIPGGWRLRNCLSCRLLLAERQFFEPGGFEGRLGATFEKSRGESLQLERD
jgi:hypothetical protein